MSARLGSVASTKAVKSDLMAMVRDASGGCRVREIDERDDETYLSDRSAAELEWPSVQVWGDV